MKIMKKFLLLFGAVLTLASSPVMAATHQTIDPDLNSDDTMNFIAFQPGIPGSNGAEEFAILTNGNLSGGTPSFDIHDNTTYGGLHFNDKILAYVSANPIPMGDVNGLVTALAGKADSPVAYSSLTGLPSLFDGVYSHLTGIPSTFTPAAHTHQLSDIIGLGNAATLTYTSSGNAGSTQVVIGSDTRLTDARTPLTHTHAISDVTGLTAALAGKQATITTGTSSQYLKGDLTLGTFPTIGSPSYAVPTFSSATTAAVLDNSRAADVTYATDVSFSLVVGGTQTFTETLTYADNSAMTTNPVVVDSTTFTAGGVASLNTTQTFKVSGSVPAGKFRKLTFATSATGLATAPTAPTTLRAAQEVLR